MTEQKHTPTGLKGPLFEPKDGGQFRSIFDKEGAHYNIYSVKGGIDSLKHIFPDGEANDLNFCLFSTSGIHGTYTTIEKIERYLKGRDKEGHNGLTFLIVHPRLVCLRYGEIDVTLDDIPFLKKLRDTSYKAMTSIGKATQEPTL